MMMLSLTNAVYTFPLVYFTSKCVTQICHISRCKSSYIFTLVSRSKIILEGLLILELWHNWFPLADWWLFYISVLK